jgi:methylmalonyl-CoA mutase cobalamin-binding subunit
MSVAEEHRLSDTCRALADHLEAGLAPPPSGPVRLMLGCVDGNYHDMGLRFFALRLRERGEAVRLVAPSAPDGVLLAEAKECGAAVVELSIFDRAQFQRLPGLTAALRALPSPPRVALGGSLFTDPSARREAAPYADYVHDPYALGGFDAFLAGT